MAQRRRNGGGDGESGFGKWAHSTAAHERLSGQVSGPGVPPTPDQIFERHVVADLERGVELLAEQVERLEFRSSLDGTDLRETFLPYREAVAEKLNRAFSQRLRFIGADYGPWPPDIRSDRQLTARLFRVVAELTSRAQLCFEGVLELGLDGFPAVRLIESMSEVTGAGEADSLPEAESRTEDSEQGREMAGGDPPRSVDHEATPAEQEDSEEWPVIGQLARHLRRAELISRALESSFQDKALFAESFSGLLSSLGLALLSPVGEGVSRLRYANGHYLLESLDRDSGELVSIPTELSALQVAVLPPLREPNIYSFDAYKFELDLLPPPIVYAREVLRSKLQACLDGLQSRIATGSDSGLPESPEARSSVRAEFAKRLSDTLRKTELRVEAPNGSPSLLAHTEATDEFFFVTEGGERVGAPSAGLLPKCTVVLEVASSASGHDAGALECPGDAPLRTPQNQAQRDRVVGDLGEVADIESARTLLKELKAVLAIRGERVVCPKCSEPGGLFVKVAGRRNPDTGHYASLQFVMRHARLGKKKVEHGLGRKGVVDIGFRPQ